LEADTRLHNILRIQPFTSKRTPHFTIAKINWLTLFEERIAVYSENHKKPQIQIVELLVGQADGTYSCHSALKS
jgi:hypothetical protein